MAAELEILGIDLSQHVLSFYTDLLDQLGVTRSAGLHRCRAGDRILVAGVKIATQTPAIRSGLRIIFTTLDDATGPVDLAFFESVQPRCAARVFGSWLLVVRGRVRRTGESVSINAEECWDLAALEEIRTGHGMAAVRAAMAAGDVPRSGGPASRRAVTGEGTGEANPKIIYPNGFVQSPYAETGSPGGALKDPPRTLWHASPGSFGEPPVLPGRGGRLPRQRPDRVRVERRLGQVERELARRPGVAVPLVQLLGGQRAQPHVPDQRQPPQPAVRFIEVLRGEQGQVGGGGDGRGVPPVRLGGPAGQPGFQLGQVIDEMIGHPPDGLVRGVQPRRLAFDGCLGRDAIPAGQVSASSST